MFEVYCIRVQSSLEAFYEENPRIGASHGLNHAMAVHRHGVNAIASHNNDNSGGTMPDSVEISRLAGMEIRVAAMLHDVDDRKYFPARKDNEPSDTSTDVTSSDLPNALGICLSAGIPPGSVSRILQMIRWVGCTENGNRVPPEIETTNQYHLLIPRWSDRLEAVGRVGVIRCYQYNREMGAPLWKDGDLYDSPRPNSEEELWEFATSERFQDYMQGVRDGNADNKKEGDGSSMISHYYDKLLHVARPPNRIVRNKYLEERAKESSKELVQVCLRFGKTGKVDEDYLLALEKE